MYCKEEMTEGGPDGKDQVYKGWYKKEINNLGFLSVVNRRRSNGVNCSNYLYI